MKDIQKREAVIASVFPLVAVLVAGVGMGLAWPLVGWWAIFFVLLPIAVVFTAHPLYRLVIRPRRVRRYLRKLGVPARRVWEDAISLERSTRRDFMSWENPLLLMAIYKQYSGYPWMWDVYQKLAEFDLGADWDQFFSKVWKRMPSKNFAEETRVEPALPFLELLAAGKTNVTDLGRLMQSDLSLNAVLAIVRDDIPVEYAKEMG